MAYSTADDVRGVLSPGGSTDAKLGTAASLEDEQIEESIQEADAQIDSRLSGRYTVPFGAEPDDVPDVVTMLSRDIAAYLATLVNRRGSPVPTDDPVRLRYVRALAILDQIASGTSELVGVEGPVTSTSEAEVVNQYEGRMFTLDDFKLGTERETLGWLSHGSPWD